MTMMTKRNDYVPNPSNARLRLRRGTSAPGAVEALQAEFKDFVLSGHVLAPHDGSVKPIRTIAREFGNERISEKTADLWLRRFFPGLCLATKRARSTCLSARVGSTTAAA